MVEGATDPRRPAYGRSPGPAVRTSKHELPAPRPGAVVRGRLLDHLSQSRPGSVVSIVAPAGYGKTTLLRQWADRDPRVAYVRLDGRDDDPAVLLSDLIAGFHGIEAIDPDLLSRLASRGTSPGLRAVQRFVDAIWSIQESSILMLDDLHSVAARPSTDALSWLAERLPDALRMVVAGRSAVALPLARLVASGRLVSIVASDLAFDADQVLEMARSMGLELPRDDALGLVTRTGGWPVAIYLSLLPDRPDPAPVLGPRATSGSQQIAEFMRRELLDPLDADDQTWLIRSSVLETMSGPLCDAALDTTGSLVRLRSLEHANVLIERMDEAGSYRYHPLFRDLLRDELELRLPGEAAAIARRASAWCDEHGLIDRAVDYAHLGGDLAAVADIVARGFWAIHWAGRILTMERWFRWFDQDGVRDRFPAVAVFAGFMHALEGRRHEAELWLAAAERSQSTTPMPDGTPDKAPWVAVLRGLLMPAGLSGMAADVRVASDGMAHDSPVMPTVRLEAAVERLLAGSFDEAALVASDAVGIARMRGALPGLMLGLGLQAWLALRAGDARSAREITQEGIGQVSAVGLEESMLSALLYAVGARIALAAGSTKQATDYLGVITRLRPRLTAAVPWLSVGVRLEAIRACLALQDAASARALLLEVDDILRVRPDLGTLTKDTVAVRGMVADAHDPGSGQWALTAAELRVLAFLPTHLTFPEIAERLFVSPYTVKSQAVAIYGKLGVASRRAAIERAVEIGLLEESVLRFPSGTSGTGVG